MDLAMHSSQTLISSPFCTFLVYVWKGLLQTGKTLYIAYTRSYCDQTIITLIQKIKIDHVLL